MFIKLVADLLMASKGSLRKAKYEKGLNAESSTTMAISVEDHEGDAIERHVQNV